MRKVMPLTTNSSRTVQRSRRMMYAPMGCGDLTAGRPRPAGGAGRCRERVSCPYLIEVNVRSNELKYAFATPFTFLEWIRFVLSQTNGMAGACSTIILSISAQAW